MTYTGNTENRVNALLPDTDQELGQVVGLKDGGWVVTWIDDAGAAGSADDFLWQRVYDENGNGGTAVRVGGTFGQANHVLKALDTGGWVVVWTTTEEDGDLTGIYHQAFSANGATLGAGGLVNDTTEGSQANVAVAALDGGGWVITFTSNDGGPATLFEQAFTSAGVADGVETPVTVVDVNTSFIAPVAALDGGGWVVAWFNDDDPSVGGYSDGVFQRKFTDASSGGAEVGVNTITGENQRFQQITAIDSGWVVTWVSDVDGTGSIDQDILQQRYNLAGTAQGGPVRVNTTTTGNQTDATITRLDDAGWVVTWKSSTATNTIYSQAYTATGALLGSEQSFSANAFIISGNQISVAGLVGGGYVIVWAQNSDIWQQVFKPDGTKDGVADEVSTTASASGTLPKVTALHDGGWTISWSSQTLNSTSTAGQYDIQQRTYHLDAAGAPPTDIIPHGTLTVAEGRAANSAIASPFTAIDADTAPAGLTFSLVNSAGGRFSITTAGQLRVANGVLLDFEQAASHVIRVSVSDGTSTRDENFTVSVSNVASENLTGTALADKLVGGVGIDTFRGVGGSDTLNGGGNDDKLYGQAGNDTLIGGAGMDTLVGGTENDTYALGAESDATDTVTEAASGGTGDRITSTITRSLNTAEYANIEHLTLLGAAAINATGNARSNTLTGNTGVNRLDGLGGTDTLRGLLGNDIYVVTAGDIVDESVAGSGGVDTVMGAITINLANAALVKGGVENATLTGAAAINAFGNGLVNRLTGNAGANRLDGGLRNDILTGGVQNDIFAFTTAIGPTQNRDTITDFRNLTGNNDRIALDDAIFVGISTATMGANFKNGAATTANHRILYTQATGVLSYDADGNGAGVAIQFAVIQTKVALAVADFLVI